FISVDPYVRGRMDDRKPNIPPFEVGMVLDSDAGGEVIAVTGARSGSSRTAWAGGRSPPWTRRSGRNALSTAPAPMASRSYRTWTISRSPGRDGTPARTSPFGQGY